jgi:hypothetical protein
MGTRVAIDIVGWRTNQAGARAEIGHGIRIAPQAFDPANAIFRRGIGLYGAYSIAIDMSSATAGEAAIKLGDGHKLA